MAIKLPELDDKTYDELVDEARAAIPTIYPQWSDHNPSDPGIALVEMLAFLTEAVIYRTGRISEKTERSFLRLLSGSTHGTDVEIDLGAAIEATLRDLRRPYRAVTAADYEQLLLTDFSMASRIARGYCLVERNVAAADKFARAPGHVSLVVLPNEGDPWAAPSAALTNAIVDFFTERRVITTSLHVVSVSAVPISLAMTVYLRDDAPPDPMLMRSRIAIAVMEHFHPVTGGPSRLGWPLGRDIDISDVLAVVDEVSGVEFVDSSAGTWTFSAPNDVLGSRLVRAGDGRQLGLRIEAHELPRFAGENIVITLRERRGTTWQTIG